MIDREPIPSCVLGVAIDAGGSLPGFRLSGLHYLRSSAVPGLASTPSASDQHNCSSRSVCWFQILSITADVVVIGGGINGCCTAYALANSGVRKVILIEKGHIAWRPNRTVQMGSCVSTIHMRRLRLWRATALSLENFGDLVGGDVGFVQCGAVMLVGEKNGEAVRSAAPCISGSESGATTSPVGDPGVK